MKKPHQNYGSSPVTQCYLPPDTSGHAPPNHSQASWYLIFLPQRDGRLSWPRRVATNEMVYAPSDGHPSKY